MKFLVSHTRGDHYGCFSSYNRQNQPNPKRRIWLISPATPLRRLCRSYPCAQASQYPKAVHRVQTHSISRCTRRLLSYGSVPTPCLEFVPDALRKKWGALESVVPVTHPLWQVTVVLSFVFPTYKITITITPLNTFSPLDGGCYNYNITIAGYYISLTALWRSVQVSNLSILQSEIVRC